MKNPRKKSNQQDDRLVFNPESCVACGYSLGDAELGAMLCHRCRNPYYDVCREKSRLHKKSNKEVNRDN